MRKVPLITGQYYHIYNRGVDKRIIFEDESDYFRFLKSMRLMNDPKRIFNSERIHNMETESPPNKDLVEIVAYCLMPNHFHFILHQVVDGGISKFMQKLLVAYTQYFNIKYQRTGVLFQGAFKAKMIMDNEYLLHLSRYIHQNPDELLKDIGSYKWSSLQFYLDKSKRGIIRLNKKVVLDQFNNKFDINKFYHDTSSSLESFSSLLLDN